MSSQLPVLTDRKSHAFLMAALDQKQKLYVEARMLGSVPVVAARMAGYKSPDESALELERDPTVRMAVEVSVRMQAREAKVTREDVLGWMQDAMRNATSSTEQLNAAKEIARLLNFYEPVRVDINKTVTMRQEQLRSLSDEELLKLSRDTVDGEYQLLDFQPEPVNAPP